MFIFRYFIFLALITSSFCTLSRPTENWYMIIENNIDNEYFVTSVDLDYRFTGPSQLSKYAANNISIGYMGKNEMHISPTTKIYMDVWLVDSPVDYPYIGNRCMVGNGCPNSYIAPDVVAKDGFYHLYQEKTVRESNYVRPAFSQSFYEYLKNKSINGSDTFHLYTCYTRNDYDINNNQTCQDVGGKTENLDLTATKVAHLKLKSTNALQEIFVDSNGNPILGLGSKFCEIATINKQNGVMCALGEYDFKGSIDSFGSSKLGIRVNVSPTIMNNKLISKNDLLIGNGNNKWQTFDDNTSSITNYLKLTDLLGQSDDKIYIFMANSFLKKIIDNKIDLSRSQDMFTFLFKNNVAPQSGYYEFTPSNTLIIKPRDYGISIVSKDLVSKPHREGKVGDKEPPLLFDYIVTTSAFRQADKITASVEGPQTTIRGQPYCLFTSKDKKINVPFSAYLSYTNERGQKISARSACNNAPVDLKDALWTETTWPYPYHLEGYFYRTDLQLSFPMNEGTSLYSLEGEDWIGVVEASGYVNVFAEWSGPDIH
ncbi:fimbrial protein [Proteus hauseri]|uniref:fimbrial protein n=1 Tax=Proteus hauseri TaxID=183417 RepID=UPI0032DA3B13